MFIRWILPLSVTLVLGILVGRASVKSSGADTLSVDPPERARSSSKRSLEPSPHRDRQPQRVLPVPSEANVSITTAFAGKLLSDSKFLSCRFDEIGGRLEQALTLVGATPSQREGVIDLFKRTEQEIYDSEKQHVRVRMSGPSEIWLNMFGMDTHAHQILKNTRSGIRELLDRPQADALIQGIDWSRFYSTSYNQELLLKVVRRNGTLFRMEDGHSTGRFGSSLPSDKFPYDSPSFSAEEVFKGQNHAHLQIRDWSHLLAGKAIVPVDEPRANNR